LESSSSRFERLERVDEVVDDEVEIVRRFFGVDSVSPIRAARDKIVGTYRFFILFPC
jgi:hypothetical protein